jgi:hypothetical protein
MERNALPRQPLPVQSPAMPRTPLAQNIDVRESSLPHSPHGPAQCELGALDLYDIEGHFIERIELIGDHHSLAIDLAHLVPRLLASACKAVILRHLHPSGIAEPSDADLIATRAFAGLLRLLGMRLHDHIIEGAGSLYSFRSEGLI